MKKITLFGVAALLCLSFSGSAQFYKPSAQTVHIGEQVPATVFEQVFPAVDFKTGKTTTVSLGSYRDKLVILDFWAT